MFDIGWSELLLIAIVALIVVGPKDLPAMFRTVGQYMGRARGMAREFQRSMEQAADDSGLKEAANSLKGVDRFRSPTASARKFAEKTVGSDPFAETTDRARNSKSDKVPTSKPATAGADKGAPAPDEQPDKAPADATGTEDGKPAGP